MTVQDNVPNPLIHKVTLAGNESRRAKTRLDEIFEDKEERAAKRFSAAELDKMALEAENEASRLRGEPPKYKYGGGEVSEEKAREDEDKKRQLMGQAAALIEQGMEPEQVGRLLLALPSVQGGATVAPVAQGMTIKDVKDIMDMVSDRSEATELRSMIASLEKEVRELAKGGGGRGADTKPIDPVTFATQQAEAVMAWNEALQTIMPKPAQPVQTGESLEVVKEKNRHEEKLQEINADVDYKRTITNIATDIPERVGRGIAGQFREERRNDGGGGEELESIICAEEGCGAKIFITPETGPQVICPGCKTIYQRKGTVETKAD